MEYKAYRYGHQDFNDIGFGCSYRNIQTIISAYNYYYDKSIEVPHIKDLLKYYYENYKNIIEIGNTRNLWIEPYQISKYLEDKLSIKPRNLLYIIDKSDTNNMIMTNINEYTQSNIFTKDRFIQLKDIIYEHFTKSKLPIVIDNGIYSYCIHSMGGNSINIIDPHTLDDNGILYTKLLKYLQSNFWMIYIPQNYNI
tara:strand:- start:1891 stop:2478 length:588 start_codon:yes stop_codon:yes gene_type:complete